MPCDLDHGPMQQECNDKGISAVCPGCDAIFYPFYPILSEDTVAPNLLYLTREECKLLELEFSTHWINRDRYSETHPLILKIFRFTETGKVD